MLTRISLFINHVLYFASVCLHIPSGKDIELSRFGVSRVLEPVTKRSCIGEWETGLRRPESGGRSRWRGETAVDSSV